jgi:hypothetical protein
MPLFASHAVPVSICTQASHTFLVASHACLIDLNHEHIGRPFLYILVHKESGFVKLPPERSDPILISQSFPAALETPSLVHVLARMSLDARQADSGLEASVATRVESVELHHLRLELARLSRAPLCQL